MPGKRPFVAAQALLDRLLCAPCPRRFDPSQGFEQDLSMGLNRLLAGLVHGGRQGDPSKDMVRPSPHPFHDRGASGQGEEGRHCPLKEAEVPLAAAVLACLGCVLSLQAVLDHHRTHVAEAAPLFHQTQPERVVFTQWGICGVGCGLEHRGFGDDGGVVERGSP